MILSSKNIETRDDRVKLKITPNGKLACVYSRLCSHYSSVSLYEQTETTYKYMFSSVSSRIPKTRTEGFAGSFDISPNGHYVVLDHADPEMVSGLYSTSCYLWNVKKRKYYPHFVRGHYHGGSFATGVDVQHGYYYRNIQFQDNYRFVTMSDTGDISLYDAIQQRLIISWSTASKIGIDIATCHHSDYYIVSEENIPYGRGKIGPFLRVTGSTIQYPDGQTDQLKTGNFIRLWHFFNREVVREFECPLEMSVTHLTVSPDDKWLAGYGNEQTHLWEIETGKRIQTLPKDTKPIGFIEDNQVLVVQSGKHQIRLWNIERQSWDERNYHIEGELHDPKLTINNQIITIEKTINNWNLVQIQLENQAESKI